MIKLKMLPVLGLLITMLGCQQNTEEIEDLQSRLLSAEIEMLELRTELAELQNAINTEAIFDPAGTEGFQKIDTNNGSFLIVLDGVERHLDGYKLRLRIGNPSYVTYNGGTINLAWGERYVPSDTLGFSGYTQWQNSLQRREHSFSDDIPPGSWKDIELTVAPVEREKFGHLAVSMTTSRVSLYTQSQ
jgi:hypothetical protein